MEPSGLGLLFQNLGPATASLVAGQRDRQAQDEAGLEQQIKQAQLAQAQQTLKFGEDEHPFTLDRLGLANKTTQQTYDINAPQAESAKVNGAQMVKNAGQKLSDEQLTMQADRGNKLGQLGLQLAPQLAQIPDAQKPQVVQAFLQQAGIDPNNPTVQGIFGQLKNVPPGQWPQILTNYSNSLVKNSASYMQAKMEKDSAERIAAGHDATSIKVANISQDGQTARAAAKAQAAHGVANIEQALASGKLSYEKAAVVLKAQADIEQDPEIKQALLGRAAQYEQANLNARSATSNGKVDPASLGMQTQKVEPALGNRAKAGTAENPIVLK